MRENDYVHVIVFTIKAEITCRQGAVMRRGRVLAEKQQSHVHMRIVAIMLFSFAS